jgi:hypothetical protein
MYLFIFVGTHHQRRRHCLETRGKELEEMTEETSILNFSQCPYYPKEVKNVIVGWYPSLLQGSRSDNEFTPSTVVDHDLRVGVDY